ncbi:MAG: hypothetical protein WA632_14640 [Gallionella sp.]
MNSFTPCRGKTACRDDGEECLNCNRSFAEIEQTRALIDAITKFAMKQDYGNVAEFAAYLADKVEKKVGHRREASPAISMDAYNPDEDQY